MAMKTPVVRRLTARLLLAAEAAACAVALAAALMPAPAPAQFIDDRYPFLEERARRNRQMQQDPSRLPGGEATRAPVARRIDVPPAMYVGVLGDSMADWLAFGLEEALTDTPEIGVSRKLRPASGLIRGEGRVQAYDWVQGAREILAAEKFDFIVMMVGLHDREPIRDRQIQGAAGQPPAPGTPAAGTQTPSAPPTAAEAPPAQPESLETAEGAQPNIMVPETARGGSAAAGGAVHEFRSEKWVEYYGRRIDETIAVLKSKGVPVYWVGLPPIRGPRAASDMAYLNDLFRSRAERAGIVYVDVWDGFVDENGSYVVQGPDFEGQIRRLRSADGVYFTKPGARKLAHYVEREIRRAVTARGLPVAMPAPEEPTPVAPGAQQAARPGGVPARPIAAPAVSLTALSGGTDVLLGAGGSRAAAVDPTTAKVLVKGEPIDAQAGRADDFVWPRRKVAIASDPGPEPVPESERSPARPSSAPPVAARPGQRAPGQGVAGVPAGTLANPGGRPVPPRGIGQNEPPPRRQGFSLPFFWPFGR